MQAPDALREIVERSLADLEPFADLGELVESVRYAVCRRGQADQAGALPRHRRGRRRRRRGCALDAAAALELVHTFSLVHDDLPALDDDDERRGRPSAHVAHGEACGAARG